MASVPITIDGVLFDKYGRTTQLVRLMGEASITGLGVGGGPIMPPDQPGKPPGGDHIWGGGNEPFPTPPIANVPGAPGYRPPKPPDPTEPPVHWKTIWTPTEGWVVVGMITPEGPHPTPSSE